MDNRPLPPHHEQMFLAPPHHHHPHYPVPLHRCAPECDDQLAVFSTVGRGLRGDSYKIELRYNENGEMYLEGMQHDAATNTWTTDWISGVIDGGRLTYEYNLNEHSNPQTFTITFRYTYTGHPEREWTWTTPAIPYFSQPLEDIVDLSQLAKILGLTEEDLQDILDDEQGVIIGDGFTGDNIKDYIDNKPTGISQEDAEDIAETAATAAAAAAASDLSDHIHEDMGFGTLLINDGDTDTKNPKRNTIKKWLDWIISQLGFGTDINNFDSTGATTIKQYIKNLRDYIATQLGFGDNINQFGDTGATTIKEYIQALIDAIQFDVENPTLYTKTVPCTLVLYELPHNATVGTVGIPTTITAAQARATEPATITVSYFDMLPSVDVSVEATQGYNIMMPTGDMIIACVADGSDWKPINLGTIKLDHRGTGQDVYMKPPVLNPETLSNSGATPSTWTPEGSWQIYTGVGNVKAKTAVADPSTDGGWPWYKVGSGNPFYLYLFNRTIGAVGPSVSVDYARVYSARYEMATEAN